MCRRLSSFGGSKCIRAIAGKSTLVPQSLSFVERSIILCPYPRKSTIGGFTVGIDSAH